MSNENNIHTFNTVKPLALRPVVLRRTPRRP